MNLRDLQLEKLQRLLALILPGNAFYRDRLPRRYRPKSLDRFIATCPLLSKDDINRDRTASPPYGTNLTWPIDRYTRYCQTSGTTGRPLPWLDTPEDWGAMLRCWRLVYEHAGVRRGADRLFFAFSFGPFLGFWTAFEAALAMDLLVIPGGGLSSVARLRTMIDNHVSVLCCTPTYAVRLGEVRAEQKVDTSVRLLIVAGEPGGSIPATRQRLERLWPGARVFDHHGLTEAGPVSYEDPAHPGSLRVIESSYFAEVLDPDRLNEVPDGAEGELILTTLDRAGCPLLRFRTGDRVRKRITANGDLSLDGGILSRMDDMVFVRGVNVYPAAIEAVLRRFAEVAEYQVREDWANGMLELRIVVEIDGRSPRATVRKIEAALQDAFTLRIPVEVFPLGSLPRFEFKSRRWIKAPALGEAIADEAAVDAPHTPERPPKRRSPG